MFISCVESGDVRVGNRPSGEIIQDFRALLQDFLHGTSSGEVDSEEARLGLVVDHRESLHAEAKAQHEAAHVPISIILYATWIEHSINGLLIRGFERQRIPQRIIRTLIRSANVESKMKSLWSDAELPPLDHGLMRSIRQVTERRNAFVHYKWDPEPDEPRDSEMSYIEALSACEDIVSGVLEFEDSFYWSGRRAEMLAAFRQDLDHAPRS